MAGYWPSSSRSINTHKKNELIIQLELVFTIAAPSFDILIIGCVLNTKTAYTTA